MSEKQLNLFPEMEEDDPSRLPPIGSEWQKINTWVENLEITDVWVDPFLDEIVFATLGLSDPISMKFIHHMLWCIKVFDIKQQNYGPKNIAKLGESGIMSRVKDDKFSRLETLNAHPENALEGEPALDAWHDACVYGGIGAMVHVGDWPSREELGLNNKSLEEVCRDAIEMAAAGDGYTTADALRYIEESLPR